MKTYKAIYSISLITVITFLFLGSIATLVSGCIERKDRRITAPIIGIKHASGTSNYIVMLEGERVKAVYQTNFRVTIRPNSEPALAYTVDHHGKILFSPDYEFTFASYAQAKEYLHIEVGKDAQIYATAEATSSCFISTTVSNALNCENL